MDRVLKRYEKQNVVNCSKTILNYDEMLSEIVNRCNGKSECLIKFNALKTDKGINKEYSEQCYGDA